MSIEDQIVRFTNYFQYQIKTISELSLPDGQARELRLYQKTLLVAVIDRLAGFRFNRKNYPELSKQNQKRFKCFVREYGKWPNGSLVSVPFLASRLEKQKEPKSLLLEQVSAHLKKFDPQAGNSISLETIDLEPEVLHPFVKTEAEKNALESVQHWSLLYRYRNSLVHDSLEPGHGWEIFAEHTGGSACYHGYIGDPRFHLVYPINLFSSIARASVEGIEGYFLQHKIDPYEYIEDTARW